MTGRSPLITLNNGVKMPLDGKVVQWMEKVTDAQYGAQP
jgi:hypothetical protein